MMAVSFRRISWMRVVQISGKTVVNPALGFSSSIVLLARVIDGTEDFRRRTSLIKGNTGED